MTGLGYLCLALGGLVLAEAVAASIWIAVLRRQSAQLELEACTLRRKLRTSSQAVEAEANRSRVEALNADALAHEFDARPDSGAT
jgi:hypothetical protein